MINSIDKIDSTIIKLLQKDGRMPYTEIAKRLNISEGAVRKRMSRLLDQKIIQVVAVGNRYNQGYGVSGFFILSVSHNKLETVIEQLNELKEIWFISQIVGSGGNLYAEFFMKSFEDYSGILSRISALDGITKLDTHINTNFIKEDYNWESLLTETENR